MDDILATAVHDRSSYPLWMLFNVPLLKQTGDFVKSLPYYPDQSGNSFAPVFTDKDLAKRWVDENSKDKNELLPIENLERICYMLRVYLRNGVKYVGIDMSSRKFGQTERHGQTRTIEIFLKEIEANH